MSLDASNFVLLQGHDFTKRHTEKKPENKNVKSSNSYAYRIKVSTGDGVDDYQEIALKSMPVPHGTSSKVRDHLPDIWHLKITVKDDKGIEYDVWVNKKSLSKRLNIPLNEINEAAKKTGGLEHLINTKIVELKSEKNLASEKSSKRSTTDKTRDTFVAANTATGKHVIEGLKGISDQGERGGGNVRAIKTYKEIQPISSQFTTTQSIAVQVKAHEEARLFLEYWLPSLGASIEFISSPEKEIPDAIPESCRMPLDPTIFSWEATNGVQVDIQGDGKRNEETIVIYGVASQFNGCESPGPYTVNPGQAVKTYESDHTQGPQAQLQFGPVQVELLNAAGNLGMNGLVKVLNESTKDAISHGYLMPKTQEQALSVLDQLKKHGHRVEYLCVANVPKGGSKLVHQILVAAPATGYNSSVIDPKIHRKLEYAAALIGFRAQFAQAIRLAQREKKPVILNAVAVGLGVFKNDAETVAMAFHQAAVELQNELANINYGAKEEERLDIKVRFQVFQGTDGKALKVVKLTGLKVSN